jgi:hypothetical protein
VQAVTTIGISMIRDEADVIEGTLRHMADEVDHLIVADNLSSDGTRDTLDRLAAELPLTVVDDPDPAYHQSAKMSRLAEQAAEMGAMWIVPFDADELWIAPQRIRATLDGLDCQVVEAVLFNHLCTAIDPGGADPFVTMQWRHREPGALPKVAFRWEPGAVIHQGNHGVTLPSAGTRKQVLEIRHFPARSADQFATKAVNGAQAYRHTSLPESEGAHWRAYGRIYEQFGRQGLENVFRQHWWYLSPVDAGLVYDPAPYRRWQTP